MLTFDSRITWRGWSTTLRFLELDGWEVRRKPRFGRTKRGCPLGLVGEYIYFQHSKECMLARISLMPSEFQPQENGSDGQHYHLDFLINKKQLHQRLLHVHQEKYEIEPGDIPALYEMILLLQNGYPKRELPEAEIIKLSEAA